VNGPALKPSRGPCIAPQAHGYHPDEAVFCFDAAHHWPTLGRLKDFTGALGAALAVWAARDDSQAQPEVRQAANTAMDAIDSMLAELHAAGAALAAEIRESDDAAAVRADALLATLRRERPGGRP